MIDMMVSGWTDVIVGTALGVFGGSIIIAVYGAVCGASALRAVRRSGRGR